MKKAIKIGSIVFLVLGISGLIFLYQHNRTTGDTPLHIASAQGNIPIAKLLIALGADVNAKNNDGKTPFFMAAHCGYRPIAKRTMTALAEFSPTASWGCNEAEMVQLLIVKGADPNAKADFGETPLFWAAYRGHNKVVQLPIDKEADVDPEIENYNGETLLHAAAKGGIKVLAEQLIKKGSDLNAKNNKDKTPLFLAAEWNHKDTAEILLAEGADVNAKDQMGRTPIYSAIYDHHIEMTKILIAKGADLNAKDKSEIIPILTALIMGYQDIVELLLAHGAEIDPKAVYLKDNTLLHIVAQHGNKNLVEQLIAKGADVNAKTKYGETPLSQAIKGKHKEIADLLRQHGAVE